VTGILLSRNGGVMKPTCHWASSGRTVVVVGKAVVVGVDAREEEACREPRCRAARDLMDVRRGMSLEDYER
jgi:hypothetical protein